uniref:NADH-ubiquinone oxidoreductase chain 2 n=1 Tax=Rhipiphorothrips cruentatus TaxID=764491 RepID=A0A8A5LBJ6_9NEOP|nr:NADH dehydrogenase subunit 2 [Rhipiphorothrips cruentatus]
MFNLTNNFLFCNMIISIFISASTNNFIWMWFMMEVNSIMIIPIFMMKNSKINLNKIIKFFIIQALSSNLLILTLISTKFLPLLNSKMTFFLLIIMSFKMGSAPFQTWALNFLSKMKWISFFMFTCIQKLIPLFMLVLFFKTNLIMILILFNSIFSTMGLKFYLTRSIMFFSSLNHLSWTLLAMMNSMKMTKLYFFIYSVMTLLICMILEKNKLNTIQNLMLKKTYKPYQNKSNDTPKIMFMFMSIPPFITFMPKILIIMNLSLNFITLILFMLMFNFLSFLFYLRFILINFMNNYSIMKSKITFNQKKMTLNFISNLSLILIPSFFLMKLI